VCGRSPDCSICGDPKLVDIALLIGSTLLDDWVFPIRCFLRVVDTGGAPHPKAVAVDQHHMPGGLVGPNQVLSRHVTDDDVMAVQLLNCSSEISDESGGLSGVRFGDLGQQPRVVLVSISH